VSIGAPEVQTRVQELSKQVVQDLLADATTMRIATAFVQQLLATREVRDSAAALTVWVLQVSCRSHRDHITGLRETREPIRRDRHTNRSQHLAINIHSFSPKTSNQHSDQVL
jgi:hypothetical protein